MSVSGYTRTVAKRKSPKRASENRNVSNRRRSRDSYSPAELFMAGCGALILIMFLGIVITSIIGD
jgi:hypothetical protein